MTIAKVHQADYGTAPLPEAAVEDHFRNETQDFPLAIATMPATGRQRTIAAGIIILLAVATAVIAPFASIQVTRIDAFIPVLQTVLSVADLITATLLFAQFSIQPRYALLALASGYIFSGSFAFVQTLAFPGAYAPAGLIGDTLNTPGWLFVLWHTTFPAAILVYALSKDANGVATPTTGSTTTIIGITVVSALALITGLTWIVTARPEYLPSLCTANDTLQTRFANQINAALWLWGAIALTALFARRRTILDLWLMVTLLAWIRSLRQSLAGWGWGSLSALQWSRTTEANCDSSSRTPTAPFLSSLYQSAASRRLSRRKRQPVDYRLDAASTAFCHWHRNSPQHSFGN